MMLPIVEANPEPVLLNCVGKISVPCKYTTRKVSVIANLQDYYELYYSNEGICIIQNYKVYFATTALMTEIMLSQVPSCL